MSSQTPTDRLLQTLRVRVGGSTDDMLSLELFNTMDEFFRRTSAWQEELDVEMAPTVYDYVLPIPSGAVMVRTMAVLHNGVPVPTAAAPGQVQTQIGELRADRLLDDGDALYNPYATDASGGVFSWSMFRPGYISITTAPTEEQVEYPLKITVALSLEATCLECDSCGDWAVPDWMWDMYFQDWLDGVQYRMYSMVNKPWTNAQAAVYHAKRFRNAMAFRKQEILRGFTHEQYTPRRVPRFPRGWTR